MVFRSKQSVFRAVALAWLCGCAAAWGSGAAVEVVGLEARQRYPWNGLVDIDYTVAGGVGEAGKDVWIAVSGVVGETGARVAAATLEGDGASGPVGPGRHRLVWNLGKDAPGLVSGAFEVELSAWRAEGAYLAVDLSGGAAADRWPVRWLDAPPAGGWTDGYKTEQLVLRWLPPGAFRMGSPAGETGHRTDETLHAVTIAEPFCLGVFEVTQGQWERVAGTAPSFHAGETRPVERVGYEAIRGAEAGAGWPANALVDAGSFLGVLRAKTGLAFDLPTEAQWEYACRAGTATSYNDGSDLQEGEWRGCEALDALGRYCYNGGIVAPADGSVARMSAHAPVGSYVPNAWGLHDMHGNAWEWCLDWYGPYDPEGAVSPRGPERGTTRVARGGCWYGLASGCRSASRHDRPPDYERCGGGFRVACPAGTVAEIGTVGWTGRVPLSGWLGAEWTEAAGTGNVAAEVVSGPGASAGGEIAFAGMGEVVVAVTAAGEAASPVARTVTVSKASARVFLEGAEVQEAGRVAAWTVRTEPEGLAVALRYDVGEPGGPPPQSPGRHTVAAEVADGLWEGHAEAVFAVVAQGEYLVVDMSGGLDAESWPVEYLDAMPEGGWPEEFKTDRLVLRRVEPGTFTMGSPEDEIGRKDDETLHKVEISRPYWMGVFEVTSHQWHLAGLDDCRLQSSPACPAGCICYEELRGAEAGARWPADGGVDPDSFLGRLRARTGLAFDLPTEAQWEYACRAGTSTALNSGLDLEGTWNEARVAEVARYVYNSGQSGAEDGKGDGSGRSAPAGSYLPNAWGLFDMHGNVSEFCLDWYGPYGTAAATAVVDPVGPAEGRYRIMRGGNWATSAGKVRSAARSCMDPPGWTSYFGARICCPVAEGE